MCNLYSMTKNQDAIRRLFNFDVDSTGNLQSMPGIFPDYPAPIVRNGSQATELTLARWGDAVVTVRSNASDEEAGSEA
jgi:putative SOS response-associated peptidase YedK